MNLRYGLQAKFLGMMGLALLAYLALLSAVAFTLWSLLLKYNPVGTVSVFAFLIPGFGAALSALCGIASVIPTTWLRASTRKTFTIKAIIERELDE